MRQPRSANGRRADQLVGLEWRRRVAATPRLPEPVWRIRRRSSGRWRYPRSATSGRMLDAHGAGIAVLEAEPHNYANRCIGFELPGKCASLSLDARTRPSESRTSAEARRMSRTPSVTIRAPFSTRAEIIRPSRGSQVLRGALPARPRNRTGRPVGCRLAPPAEKRDPPT